MSDFPILAEQRLAPPTRRLLRGEIRDLNTLPKPSPGVALVLQVDGVYHTFRDLSHLNGDEQEVVRAGHATLVDLRARQIAVRIALPSLHASTNFDVTAIFNCRVTNPEEVTQAGTTEWGIQQLLSHHLQSDSKLFALTQNQPVRNIGTVRGEVRARIQAFCSVRQPRIRGLSIVLSNVTVDAERTTIEHAASMLAEEQKQEREALIDQGEDRKVRRYAAMDAAHMQGLGVARGEVRIGDAADRLYVEKYQARQDLLRYMENLANNGSLDLIEPHAQQLANKLTEALTGAPVPETRALQNGHQPTRELPRQAQATDEDLPRPMEDDDDEF